MFTFSPRRCKIGVLTAALQEPFGRDPFKKDPMQAARDALTKFWIPLAGRHKIDLEVGGAFFFQDGYVPPEKMLDPVASQIPARTPKTGAGIDLSPADRDLILESCTKHGTKVRTIGVFENLLHDDDATCAQIHEHVKRMGRGAKELGADGLTLFVGRNVKLGLDANLRQFIRKVVPLLKYLVQELGLTVFFENCPMPGWNNLGLWVNNLCSTPFSWVAIHEICKREGIADGVVINYDASHTILQKGLVARTFAYMKAAGIQKMMGRIHCKDQHHLPALLAAGEGRGQTFLNGDFVAGEPAADADLWRAWCVMDSQHGFPGHKFYNPQAEMEGHEVNWLEHQYLLRQTLEIDPNNFVVTLEHEFNANRVRFGQPNAHERIEQMIAMSVIFMLGIDGAADVMHQAPQMASAFGYSLPNVIDDRFSRSAKEMAAHADEVRARVSLYYQAA